MNCIHQRLKDFTGSLHRQLDNQALFTSLLSPQANYSTIQQALQFWWGFHCAAQAAANQPQFSHWAGFLANRNKLNALSSDMDRLQVKPCTVNYPWPQTNSLAELMALLYVTEGSTLGGLAIQTVLQKSTRHYPVQLDFLTVYEPNTRAYWKQFLIALEDTSSSINSSETEAAAAAWFKALIDYAEQIQSSKAAVCC